MAFGDKSGWAECSQEHMVHVDASADRLTRFDQLPCLPRSSFHFCLIESATCLYAEPSADSSSSLLGFMFRSHVNPLGSVCVSLLFNCKTVSRCFNETSVTCFCFSKYSVLGHCLCLTLASQPANDEVGFRYHDN